MFSTDDKEKFAANILNDRNNEFALNSDELDRITNQLSAIEKKEKIKDIISNIAGNLEKTEKDHNGDPISINGKIKEVKGRKHMPYSIPIFGWILSKIEINRLKNKRSERELELIEKTGAIRYFNNNDLDVYKDEIAKRQKENGLMMKFLKKTFVQYVKDGKIPGLTIAEGEKEKTMTEEQIKAQIDLQNTEKAINAFEEQIRKDENKDKEQERQNGDVERKQEGQVNKPNPEELKKDRPNQVQGQQTHVTKAVMQQKNGVQQAQNQPAAPVPRTTISEQLGESNGSRKPEERKSSTNTNERPPTDSEVSFMVGMPIHTSYSQMNKALKELRAQEQQSRQQSQPKSQPQPQRQSAPAVSVTIGSTGGSNIGIQSNITNKNGVVARQNTNISSDGKITQQQGVLNGQQFSGQQQVLNGQNIMQGQIAQNGERKAVQMQGMNNGRVLQISAPSQAGAIINSGATGVGKGRGRGQSAGVQF